MYDYLEGSLTHQANPYVTLDIHGVGYSVGVLSTFFHHVSRHEGSALRLYIHAHHTDDGIQLYGFEERMERDFFKLLLTVSGVGPSLAMKILSVMPYGDVISAIESEDKDSLLQISGLGTKTAGKIFLDLKDKIKRMECFLNEGSLRKSNVEVKPDFQATLQTLQDVREALRHLGYREAKIHKTVATLKKEMQQEDTVETLVRKSLLILASENA